MLRDITIGQYIAGNSPIHKMDARVKIIAVLLFIVLLFVIPEIVFLHDLGVWGTRSEYARSSSYRATYDTMYDARNVYDICFEAEESSALPNAVV